MTSPGPFVPEPDGGQDWLAEPVAVMRPQAHDDGTVLCDCTYDGCPACVEVGHSEGCPTRGIAGRTGGAS